MAKTTAFSWKVTNEKYGYLWTMETEAPCITNRITDDTKLGQIVGEISSWDESKYASNFNILNNLIHDVTGNYIEGDYSKYYNGNNGGKSFIMLTGKDGGYCHENSGEISDTVIDKIKAYITSQITVVNENVKDYIEEFKTETNQKISVLNNSVNTKIDTAKEELENNTTSIIDSKMIEISNSVKYNVLEQLNNDVPVSSLQELVNGVKVNEIESFVRESINSNTNIISSIEQNVNLQNERIEEISTGLENEIRETNDRIDNIDNAVNTLNIKVNRAVANSEIISSDVEEQSQETNYSKGNDDELYMLETETIDNGDGTFDIISSIGSEVYNVRILAYGNKLKTTDKTEGLVLASNGIKFLDKSGSYISIINGNINLSNSNGSGKLEIKKDGLYINGVKQ